MKIKIFNVYGKILLYTLAILLAVISAVALFFSNQITRMLDEAEQQQITNIFRSFVYQIEENQMKK